MKKIRTIQKLNKIQKLKKSWTFEETHALFNSPFSELLYKAQTVHRKHFNPNALQISHF